MEKLDNHYISHGRYFCAVAPLLLLNRPFVILLPTKQIDGN
jgi:hypothetical protein